MSFRITAPGLIEFLERLGAAGAQIATNAANKTIGDELPKLQSETHKISGELAASERKFGEINTGDAIGVRYGTDKEYAIYEEYGNRYRPEHPFMRPSVNRVSAAYPQNIINELRKFF